MNKKGLFVLWGVLFVSCAGLGFVPQPTGGLKWLLGLLGLLFFAPPVLLLARVMDALFERHYAFASHAVLGIVAASALMILPRGFRAADLLCAAVGLVLALWMDRRQRKLKGTP